MSVDSFWKNAAPGEIFGSEWLTALNQLACWEQLLCVRDLLQAHVGSVSVNASSLGSTCTKLDCLVRTTTHVSRKRCSLFTCSWGCCASMGTEHAHWCDKEVPCQCSLNIESSRTYIKPQLLSLIQAFLGRQAVSTGACLFAND